MITRPIRPLVLGAAVLLSACADLPASGAPSIDTGAPGATMAYIVMVRDTAADANASVARIARTTINVTVT